MSGTQTITIVGKAYGNPDEVTVLVNGSDLSGWQSVRVTRGMERCPNDFEVTATEVYPGQVDEIVMRPGDPCVVKIGKDRVLTGYVNRYTGSITKDAHQISISGRGMCQDLVDCAATWPGQQIRAASVLAVAQQLGKPFGITASGATGPSVGQGGATIIPYLALMLGETAWEVIERLCRIAGLLAFEQPDGSLLLTSNPGDMQQLIEKGNAGTLLTASSGLTEGVNVLEATLALADDERFQTYQAFRFALDQYTDLGNSGNLIGTATDPGARAGRLKIIIAEMANSLGEPNALARAAWEAARRWGRGRQLRVKTDSWRDSSGALYQPNSIIDIDIPSLKLTGTDWMISEVTYSRGAGGTTCDLLMMPPQAFAVQPTLPPYATEIEIAQLPPNLARP